MDCTYYGCTEGKGLANLGTLIARKQELTSESTGEVTVDYTPPRSNRHGWWLMIDPRVKRLPTPMLPPMDCHHYGQNKVLCPPLKNTLADHCRLPKKI